MRLELGSLSPNVRRRVNKIRGLDHIEKCQVSVFWGQACGHIEAGILS